ncbi:MAG: hypothetical protein ACOX2S_09360 [bacterium]
MGYHISESKSTDKEEVTLPLAGKMDGEDDSKGEEENNPNVINCYASGTVGGDEYVGGLVGLNEEGDIRASYYDIEASGGSTHDNQWGIPKTTAEMI